MLQLRLIDNNCAAVVASQKAGAAQAPEIESSYFAEQAAPDIGKH